MQQIQLTANWELKQRDPALALSDDFATIEHWLPVAVPGSVHEALLAAGQIPDPFYGLNEQDVQWIGECDWLYRCTFEVSAEMCKAGAIALCCDGLDTFATVWVNGTLVQVSDNMFVPVRVPVTQNIQPGRNEVQILFESALRRGKEREAEYGVRTVWNGDPSRVYVRKAQYHYGWDWGPTLLTAGIWQPMRLEIFNERIAELHCPVAVADDLGTATLPVHVALERNPSDLATLEVKLELIDPAGTLIDSVQLAADDVVKHTFTVGQPQLWWPNGHGTQPLYRIAVTLLHDEVVLEQQEQRVGVRRLRLVQEPLVDEPGTTFLFEVNNTPLFCGGANWIPADSFTTRLTADHYRTLVQQAADANMVMLRVWGGGIYEADHFYDLCDELGLLVWQDFMFGCGIYPAHAEFQASVRSEAEAAVRRLRHHPALALWCGNNEDYQIAHSINVYDADFVGDFTATAFPARAIYEQLLPEVCAALDPPRPYWPGSAYGGKDVNNQIVGDRHTWDVWHGAMAPYQEYGKWEGRFVSEFGMQAAPALATLAEVIPATERTPRSASMDHHNKATDGLQRLATYVDQNIHIGASLEDYVYGTQFIQSEAMAYAYRSWRRRWAGPGRYAVAGALVWQLDDCWPVTSWAIIDYGCRPKPAYYIIRRELAPVTIGLADAGDGVSAWAVNATLEQIEATIHLLGFNLDGQQLADEHRQVTLPPNQATEVGTWAVARDAQTVIGARLVVDGTVVARATLWPEPFKQLTLSDPNIVVTPLDGEYLRVEVERPAKGVWLEAGDDIRWSDNMLDLLPGDPQTVKADGLGGRRVEVRWLT